MIMPAFGGSAGGARLERMRRSPQWRDGRFEDAISRGGASVYSYLRRQIGWSAVTDWAFRGSKHRVPGSDLRVPMIQSGKQDFAAAPATGLRITWLGHSTTLVELDGVRVLIDPVLSDYAGPTWVMGQRRFFPLPLPLAELPEIDFVVISHDHYDHLDYPSIRQLATLHDGRAQFIMPLGVGAHFDAWGIAADRICELDWWEQQRFGDVTFVATPARHYSGRGVFDLESTLWAGFAIIGPEHRVFYTGDTAMFPGLREIGVRLGPFDATLIEAGGYSRHWADIHLGPEQAVQAHHMLRGEVMVPVHWGLFDLAMHSWTEPIERVLSAASALGVRVATPLLGERFEPQRELPSERWWPELPCDTAETSPVISSGMPSEPAPLGGE
jgi:L-ascorbate metabolism protein UlaG (beta-lactamase superfamily)